MEISRTKRTSTKRKSGATDVLEDKRGIKLGKLYNIKRRGSWAQGEVVYKRYNKKNKSIEYYVNYLLFDRRLDEWVKGHRIDLISENRIPSLPCSYGCSEDSLDSEPDSLELEHRALTKVKFIKLIQFGKFEINTWYYSPYPEDFVVKEKLFICMKCFKYMCLESSYAKHVPDCKFTEPPGKMVYRKGLLGIYEVDGMENRLYCQNLALLGKLFIDHKTVCYDVESFLFYILCSKECEGSIIRGFFSKEKSSIDKYNLSCITTLPPFQQQGYGKLMIDFSYKLSILEGTPGSPEEPISDLGLITYKSYWTWAILKILYRSTSPHTLSELSWRTGITEGDIVFTLESLKLLCYWKGNNEVIIKSETLSSIVKSNKFKEPILTIDDKLICWKRTKCDVPRRH